MSKSLSFIRGAGSNDGRNPGRIRQEPGPKRGRRVGGEVPCHENPPAPSLAGLDATLARSSPRAPHGGAVVAFERYSALGSRHA